MTNKSEGFFILIDLLISPPPRGPAENRHPREFQFENLGEGVDKTVDTIRPLEGEPRVCKYMNCKETVWSVMPIVGLEVASRHHPK